MSEPASRPDPERAPAPVRALPRLAQRPRRSHKGSFGKVLLVAGSPGMSGAAVLAARGALRGGAGLVTVAVPDSLAGAMTVAVPEATHILLPELSDPDYPAPLETRLPRDLEARFDVLAIGPGLGISPASRLLVAKALERFTGPQVVDADALNLVAAGLALAPCAQRVWTPHPGEFERLTRETPHTDAERVAACERFARARGGVVLLKGRRSVTHDASRYAINLTGNPGMATGGAGDVLTGLIAALLGQGFDAFDAAQLGAHLHGLAGDLAARRLGETSLTASDLVDFLPSAFAVHAAASTDLARE
jgi:NAD(P)H-hydrate epimerase